MRLSDNQIIALSQRCVTCSALLGEGHMVVATYVRSSIDRFANNVDIGIIGANVRNFWVHLDCQKPFLKNWNMNPDLHTCIRCKQRIASNDMIQPVFQVLDANATNPHDPTDVGIALNDRVYFAHCQCDNRTLVHSKGGIILAT